MPFQSLRPNSGFFGELNAVLLLVSKIRVLFLNEKMIFMYSVDLVLQIKF